MFNWYVWSRAIFVSFGGFFFGYDVGVINGVKDMVGYRLALNLPYLPSDGGPGEMNSSDRHVNMSCNYEDNVETSAILGLIVALVSVGGLVGALMAGFISDLAGRKPVIILGASLVAAGSLLHTAAVHLWMALLSRIIVGIGIGIAYQVTPLYVAETAPESLRGRLLSFITIIATSGYLMATILNVIVKDHLHGWRISLSVHSLAGIILALGMLFLPESPRWLVKRQKEKKALQVLNRMYKDESKAQSQLVEIKSSLCQTKEPLLQTLKYLCKWINFQRLLLGFSIILFGRLTGGTVIVSFSVTLFCGIGLPGFIVSIAIGATMFGSMLLSLTVIDKFGRRPLFLMGLLVMSASHIVSASLIIAFNLEESTSRDSDVVAYFVVVFACLYLGGWATTCGNVPWIILGEIFPLKSKGLMVSICNIGFWIGIIALGQIGPILLSSPLRIPGTLLLFSGISLFFFVFIFLLLPETKGQILEKMEEVFSKPWLEREHISYYLQCSCFRRERDRKHVSEEIGRRLSTVSFVNAIYSESHEDGKDECVTDSKDECVMDRKISTTTIV